MKNASTEVALLKAAVVARDNHQNGLAADLTSILISRLGVSVVKVGDAVTAADLRIAISQGKIPAIKHFRDRTKTSLLDAKNAIETAVESLNLQYHKY